MPDWIDTLVPSVHLLELFLRGTITYLGLALLMRLVGQREAGGLGLTDLLVVLLAVNAATVGLTGDAQTIADGFVLVATVLFWSVAVDALSYRFPHVGRVFKARPRLLIEEGELNRRAMRRELMSKEEVMAQMRLHGVEDLAQVHRACIEPNGMISVVLRKPSQSSEAPESPEL